MTTTMSARSVKVASRIRRLAPRLAELAHEDPAATADHEAATLLKHLRPGRPEDAIQAHKAFARLIRDGLATHGGVQEEYATIINELGQYLELEGRTCSDGRWVTEAEAWSAGGVCN